MKETRVFDCAVLICPYGTNMTPELEEYYGKFITMVLYQSIFANCGGAFPKKMLVILPGGANNQKTFPGLTEAQFAKDHLISKLGKVGNVSFLLEERSRTTNENFLFTAELLKREGIYIDGPLVVHCDCGHWLKSEFAAWLTLRCCVKRISVLTHPVIRGRSAYWKQVLIGTPLCIAALLFPPLRWLELKRKKKIIATT